MRPDQANDLFHDNMQQVNAMQPASGSMIKQVLQTLESNNPATYIRLRDASAHRVYYEVIEGTREQVARVCQVLGVWMNQDYMETWTGED